jgi:hypothetical protein|tara:strand:- start:3579 stop:3950 length:372 start_codon:yes stop_codon:yes gene_type:complete
MSDLTKIAFDSRLNYLKRSEFVGSETVTLGGAGSNSTVTVTHGIGDIPFVTVGVNLTDTSTIWSNDRVWSETQSSLSGGDLEIGYNYWITTTTLTVQIRNGDGAYAQSGNRTIYWSIYKDYEV